jgi:hypothetical protein
VVYSSSYLEDSKSVADRLGINRSPPLPGDFPGVLPGVPPMRLDGVLTPPIANRLGDGFGVLLGVFLWFSLGLLLGVVSDKLPKRDPEVLSFSEEFRQRPIDENKLSTRHKT